MAQPSNIDRLIEIAETIFDVRHDPAQLAITPEVMERLRSIHPSTMGERNDAGEPIAWTIVIPTTAAVMVDFLLGRSSEAEVFEKTKRGDRFQSIYLCSALVLPEHRKKGVARDMMCESIEAIRREHPITSLYCWAFNPEGEMLAASVGRKIGVPLFNRNHESKRSKASKRSE